MECKRCLLLFYNTDGNVKTIDRGTDDQLKKYKSTCIKTHFREGETKVQDSDLRQLSFSTFNKHFTALIRMQNGTWTVELLRC